MPDSKNGRRFLLFFALLYRQICKISRPSCLAGPTNRNSRLSNDWDWQFWSNQAQSPVSLSVLNCTVLAISNFRWDKLHCKQCVKVECVIQIFRHKVEYRHSVSWQPILVLQCPKGREICQRGLKVSLMRGQKLMKLAEILREPWVKSFIHRKRLLMFGDKTWHGGGNNFWSYRRTGPCFTEAAWHRPTRASMESVSRETVQCTVEWYRPSTWQKLYRRKNGSRPECKPRLIFPAIWYC